MNPAGVGEGPDGVALAGGDPVASIAALPGGVVGEGTAGEQAPDEHDRQQGGGSPVCAPMLGHQGGRILPR